MSKVQVVRYFRILFAAGFVVGGANHFRDPELYLPLMPDYLPLHRELIFLSGACEILLGALILVPRFRRISAIGLIVLLIAVFPANIHMATHPEVYPEVSSLLRWGRLPLQAVLIAWVWWVS